MCVCMWKYAENEDVSDSSKTYFNAASFPLYIRQAKLSNIYFNIYDPLSFLSSFIFSTYQFPLWTWIMYQHTHTHRHTHKRRKKQFRNFSWAIQFLSVNHAECDAKPPPLPPPKNDTINYHTHACTPHFGL